VDKAFGTGRKEEGTSIELEALISLAKESFM